MKVLIINCTAEHSRYAQYTKGGDAAIIGTIQSLKRCIPDVSISTFMQCDESLRQQLSLNMITNKAPSSFKSFSPYHSLTSTLDLARAFIWRILKKHFNIDSQWLVRSKKLREIRRSDVIIHLGGDLYSSDFGIISFVEHSKNILLGSLLGKPVVIYAESPGPFEGKLFSWLAKVTLNKVALITLREEFSRTYLWRLGTLRPPVHVTADPAFLLEPVSSERVAGILLKEGINNTNQRLVGVTLAAAAVEIGEARKSIRLRLARSVSRLVQYITPESVLSIVRRTSFMNRLSSKYIDRIAKPAAQIVDYINETLHATVLLIPHANQGLLRDDDINKRVYELVSRNGMVKIIRFHDYSAQEVKGIIGSCDLLVSCRMHACVAAVSQCVPTVAVALSHKFEGVMRSVGQEQLVCANLIPSEVIAKIEKAWASRGEIREQMESRVAPIKDLAFLNATLVRDIIPSG